MIANVSKFEELMNMQGYNYSKLAKEVNIGQATLSSKIKGTKDLKVYEAFEIASFLKMNEQDTLNCFFNLHKTKVME